MLFFRIKHAAADKMILNFYKATYAPRNSQGRLAPFRLIHHARGVMTQTLDLIRSARSGCCKNSVLTAARRLHKTSTMETKTTSGQSYQGGIPMSAWAEDDLPSSKLLLKGTHSLSNSELLSIIIGNGIEGENSLDIAMSLLARCNNNLCELWKMSYNDLRQIRGIGDKKALMIISACALGRRRNESEAMQRDKIKSSHDAFLLLRGMLSEIPYEEFWMLMLDRANRVIKKHRVSEGGISGTVVDPKKVFKIALDHHACSMILCHNHPSGLLIPSEADLKITRKLVDSGKLLEIAVLDHLIIGGDQYYSFADEGKL